MNSCEVSDRVWWTLIGIATKHSARVTGLRSARWERGSVYVCIALYALSAELVDSGAIQAWPGGSRRLHVITDSTVAAFRLLHGRFHTDAG